MSLEKRSLVKRVLSTTSVLHFSVARSERSRTERPAAQNAEYNRRLDSYRTQLNAKRSRRSPDEGLFFDDSVQK